MARRHSLLHSKTTHVADVLEADNLISFGHSKNASHASNSLSALEITTLGLASSELLDPRGGATKFMAQYFRDETTVDPR